MAHVEKSNKNVKKVATKAAKVNGAPKVPKYEQSETGFTPLSIPSKDKKSGK